MKTLSDRLSYLLKKRNLSQTDLARMISVKPQVIQYLCKSNIKSSRFTFEIAQALSVSPEWLASGTGKQGVDVNPVDLFMKDKKLIPVYDYSQLLLLKSNNFKPIDQKTDFTAIHSSFKNCFGLIMPDTSMQPIFLYNSLLVVQITDNDNDNDNDNVLVFLESDKIFLIRKLIKNNGESVIMPINSNLYKEVTLTEKDNIIGKIIFCTNKF